MDLLYSTLLLISFALLTQALLKLTHRYALQHLLDTPNQRSSHTIPTPRGGGIAVAITSTALLLLAPLPIDITAIIAAACLILAIIGLADDHLNLSRRLRFGVTVITFFAATGLLPRTNLTLGPLSLNNYWLLLPLLVIGASWFLNLFNFMDGINGIAALEFLTIMLGGALILLPQEPSWSYTLILLCSPALVFLLWNFPRAKIFLGDSGSYFWGALIPLIAIATSSTKAINLWSWLILAGVFIVDSSWTLIVRFTSNQAWHSPHRSHAYQKIATQLGNHTQVSLGTAAITLLWLTPIAWCANQYEQIAAPLTLLAYLPLIMICNKLKAGHSEDA